METRTSDNPTPTSKLHPLDMGRQLFLAVTVIGALLALGYAIAELTESSAVPSWALSVGTACFFYGLIVTLLFSICLRLERIERRLANSESERTPPEGRQEQFHPNPHPGKERNSQ